MATNATPNPLPEFDTPEYMAMYPELVADHAAIMEDRLTRPELFWRDHCHWLKDSGYAIRARYQPNWVPSWKGKLGHHYHRVEDKVLAPPGGVLDAIRISDGTQVLFKKKISHWSRPLDDSAEPFLAPVDYELQIIRKFSSEPLASDPRNRCVPLLDVLRVPDTDEVVVDLMVMPLLFAWNHPPFTTIGELVSFFSQIFEGLLFMHSNNVWHGDCKYNNIMMDVAPIQASTVHPFRPTKTRDLSTSSRWLTRTQKPVKYYWIDFDLSKEHDPANGPALSLPGYGGTRNVPDFASETCDPFAVDVFCLGNMIQEHLTEGTAAPKISGLQFMDSLLADMTQQDPTKRPRMDEVVDRFSKITADLSQWKLRSRIALERESSLFGVFKSAFHWVRQLRHVMAGIPAIPSPN